MALYTNCPPKKKNPVIKLYNSTDCPFLDKTAIVSRSSSDIHRLHSETTNATKKSGKTRFHHSNVKMLELTAWKLSAISTLRRVF